MTRSLEELAGALDSTVVTRTDYSYGPSYDPVAVAAAKELVARGAEAVPVLAARLASTTMFEVPEPSYDQGMYIGDYTSHQAFTATIAAEALGELGAAAVATLPAVVETWWRSAPHTRDSCRRAVLALARHAEPAAVAHALVALADDSDPRALLETARELASFGPPAYEACCVLAAQGGDSQIRSTALHALGVVGDPAETIPQFQKLLDDPAAGARFAAVTFLTREAPKEIALPLIVDGLRRDDIDHPVIRNTVRFPEEAKVLRPLLEIALMRERHDWRRQLMIRAIAELQK